MSTALFRNGSLDEQRRAISADTRHKTEIPLEDFLDAFVPNLPGNLDLNALTQRMDKVRAWEKFSSPPAKQLAIEDDIFKNLPLLLDKMVEAMVFLKKKKTCPMQRWSLITSPRIPPTTTDRPSIFKPDAFFHRKGVPNPKGVSNPESYPYYDIAFTVEFKKHGGTASFADDHDVSKVVYAMKHIMAVDARRRFTFGMTIENTSMGLWYANRAMLIGSTPLDIIQNKEYLIRVLLSFAYASDVEMGFDPSVTHLKGDFYHINVGGTTYQTVKKLHDAGGDALLGRGARVFTVKKVDDAQDTLYVLKDIWAEKGRMPEHQIYKDIITDVGLQYTEEDVRTVKQHLLTPVDNAFVNINGVADDTETVMLRSRTLESTEDVSLPTVIPSRNPSRNSKTYTTHSDMEDDTDYDTKHTTRDPEKICHRQHYRVVFKECAKPIHKVTMVKDVFTVLADLIKVLQFIHGSGWVHRDISVGNVYLFEGRGMLGDLEYAKSTSDTSQHDVRTGTIDFMPTELIALIYLFRPPIARQMGSCATSAKPFPFHYNAIHDMESVWWLSVWMMFFHKPKGYSESKDKSLERQRQTYRIYPGTLSSLDSRFLCLHYLNTFWESTKGWVSEELSYALNVLDDVRAKLPDLYRELEATFPDGLSKLSAKADRRNTDEAFPGGPTRDIYKPIRDSFLMAKEWYDEHDTLLEPFKVSERDSNRLKMGEQTSTPGSGKQGNDHGVAEEVGEGKGKKAKRQRRR